MDLRLLLLMVVFVGFINRTSSGLENFYDVRNQGKWAVIGRMWYFSYNNTLHQFADIYTMLAYGFNARFFFGKTEFSRLREPTWPSAEEQRNLTIGEHTTSLWDNHENQVLLSLAPFSPTVLESALVCGRLNCGLLYRPLQKDWIISWRERLLRIPAMNVSSLAGANMSNVAQWLNGVETSNYPFAYYDQGIIDTRFLLMSNGRTILVSSRHNRRKDKILSRFAEVVTNVSDSSGGGASLQNWTAIKSDKDEKNWSPFEYRGEIYFLSSIWPFRSVRVYSELTPEQLIQRREQHLDEIVGTAQELSVQHLDRESCERWFKWSSPHGEETERREWRGGTQVLDLGNETFLGAFHAQNNVTDADNGALKTYTMGFFTFTPTSVEHSNVTAFRLTRVSKSPVVYRSWYSGSWVYQPNAFGMMDYVVFPMSIFVEGDVLIVVHGLQDATTWASRFSLKDVFSKLATVGTDNKCS